MLWRTCWHRTKLWNVIWVWKSTLWRPTWIFFPENSVKSVMDIVKDSTKKLWLWNSGTKASGLQVCWQTISGHWRCMYLAPNTGESHVSTFSRFYLILLTWQNQRIYDGKDKWQTLGQLSGKIVGNVSTLYQFKCLRSNNTTRRNSVNWKDWKVPTDYITLLFHSSCKRNE